MCVTPTKKQDTHKQIDYSISLCYPARFFKATLYDVATA